MLRARTLAAVTLALVLAAPAAAGAATRTETDWWRIDGLSGTVTVQASEGTPISCGDPDSGGPQVVSGTYVARFRSTRVLSRQPALREERNGGVPRSPVDPRLAVRVDSTSSEVVRTIDDGAESCTQLDEQCERTKTAEGRSVVRAIPDRSRRRPHRVLVGVVVGLGHDWHASCVGEGSGSSLLPIGPDDEDDLLVQTLGRGVLYGYVSRRTFVRKRQRIRIRRTVPGSRAGATGTVSVDATLKLRRMKRRCVIRSANRFRCSDRPA